MKAAKPVSLALIVLFCLYGLGYEHHYLHPVRTVFGSYNLRMKNMRIPLSERSEAGARLSGLLRGFFSDSLHDLMNFALEFAWSLHVHRIDYSLVLTDN